MGVSRQTITSLETEKYDPSLKLAYNISKYFNVTIDEVFIFDVIQYKLDLKEVIDK